ASGDPRRWPCSPCSSPRTRRATSRARSSPWTAASGKEAGERMQPDTTKIWTPSEVSVSIGKIIVESLGVDAAAVTDDAALIRDLGAESIDFLDISFKCQQTFGVDLPVRLVQDRRIGWRALRVLAKVLDAPYGAALAAGARLGPGA